MAKLSGIISILRQFSTQTTRRRPKARTYSAPGECLESRELLAGAPSASFGNQGKIVLPGTENITVRATTQMTDGSTIIAGTRQQLNGPAQFVITRLNQDGSQDTRFGVRSHDFTSQGYISADTAAVVADAQGRIFVSGTIRHASTGQTDIGLFRYEPNRDLEEFGEPESGRLSVVTNFGLANTNDVVSGMTIDRDGRILITGSVDRGNGNTDFAVMRLNPDGVVDQTFGVQGRRTVTFDLGGGSRDSASAVTVDSQGRILLAGSASRATGSDFAVTRLTATGVVDTTFGRFGKATIGFDLGGGHVDTANSIAVDSQGRILVGGTATTGWGDDFAVARFLSNGTADWSYGWGARQNISFNLATPNTDRAAAMKLDYLDRVVVAGTVARTKGTDFGIARLTTAGRPDLSFGPAGRRTVSFDRDAGNADAVAGMVINASNEILITGSSRAGTQDAIAVTLLEGQLITAGMQGSTLVVTGTSENDTIPVINDGTNVSLRGVTFSRDGRTWQDGDFSIPAASISDIRIDAKAGNDVVRISDAAAGKVIPARISGGSGNDTLVGGRGNDELRGGDGNDNLQGGQGVDQLDGEAGDDALNGQDGQDFIFALAGIDTVVNDGLDVIYQPSAVLDKSTGVLTVTGSALAESISVLASAQITATGTQYRLSVTGLPILITGNGTTSYVSDVLVFDVSEIRISELIGGDRVVVNTGFGSLYTGNGPSVTVVGGAGNDTITAEAWSTELLGGGGNDAITGGAGRDQISGGAGDDVLYGANGHDRLLGGTGNDMLNGGDGDDTLLGEDGTDQLHGWIGNDFLDGGNDNDHLWGDHRESWVAGADTLYGGSGDDTLEGWNGNDVLNGGDGSDTLLGEDGDDQLHGWIGNDVLDGGNGNDHLWGDHREWWVAGNDVLNGGPGNDILEGWNGNDVLNGGDGDDTLLGEDGDDQLHGWIGNDLLDGGNGNDHLWGDHREWWVAGNDVLNGGAGNDILEGWNGNDVLNGGDGDDTLLGEDGDDQLHGWIGNDLLDGGNGNDHLWGDHREWWVSGVDTLFGRAGDDILEGWNGDDRLYGGTGNDLLLGEAGNDTLDGESGRDRMIGGTGTDSATADQVLEEMYECEKTEIRSIPGGDAQFDDWSCGPNSVSRVLRAYGYASASYLNVRSRTLYDGDLFSRVKLGTRPETLLGVMRQWKGDSQMVSLAPQNEGLEPIFRLIDQGRPVVALINAHDTYTSVDFWLFESGTTPSALHYVTVTGYNRSNGTVTIMDTNGVQRVESFDWFQRRWNWRASGATGDFLTGTLNIKPRTFLF